MSDYVQLLSTGIPTQSISNVLSPGIVSLFIQGLETGLVFSQLSQWLSLERRDGFAITALVIFVTTVGLSAFTPFLRDSLSQVYHPLWTFSVETAVCFVSAWKIYVRNFGQLVSKHFPLIYLLGGLMRLSYFCRYYPSGLSPFTQCLYVNSLWLTVASPLQDYIFTSLSIVYPYCRTYSSVLYMALLSCQSLSMLHRSELLISSRS